MFHWLRGVDLNHRPLGYENHRHRSETNRTRLVNDSGAWKTSEISPSVLLRRRSPASPGPSGLVALVESIRSEEKEVKQRLTTATNEFGNGCSTVSAHGLRRTDSP
jgi:hypothetical protein